MKPNGNSNHLGANILAVSTVILLCFALMAWSIHTSRAKNKDARHEVCVQIEKLKAGFRQDAFNNYRDLDKNARLLDIKVTPELRKAAKHSRDVKLQTYAKHDC